MSQMRLRSFCGGNCDLQHEHSRPPIKPRRYRRLRDTFSDTSSTITVQDDDDVVDFNEMVSMDQTMNRTMNNSNDFSSANYDDDYAIVCNRRYGLLKEKDDESTMMAVSTSFGNAPKRGNGCIWIGLFVLSSALLAAAVAASNTEEGRRILSAVVSPENTSQHFKLHRIINFFSPAREYNLVESFSSSDNDNILELMRRNIANLQHRLINLEAAVSSTMHRAAADRIDEDSVSQELTHLRQKYDEMSSKAVRFSAYSENQDGVGVDGLDNLQAEVTSMKQMLAELSDVQSKYVADMDAVRTSTEQVDRDLINIRARTESTKATKYESTTIDTVPTIDEINIAIAAALAKYDADKTGLPDYALETSGASIVGTRCTETYSASTKRESIFGVPLWYKSFSPRTVIQPRFAPGECWAFKGSYGFLTIKLSSVIDITAVSYEHIPKGISPTGGLDSAPKKFEVYSLASGADENGLRLGEFIYDVNGPPLQLFPVEMTDSPPTNFIELRILANYGHPVYTCVYKFRVHGRRVA